MHYNYKSDEKILKTLIYKNILPTDPNKKIKLIYYKFKTSNLVMRNNSSPSIGVLQKTNVIYKFKCPLGDCISDNNNKYVGLTSTTLSRRLTMHLSDTSSIAQHLKKHSCPTTQLRKILIDNTTILEHQNNKQKLQIHCLVYFSPHHHHVMPPARISLTLSRHFSLSFIASGRSSGLHPVF